MISLISACLLVSALAYGEEAAPAAKPESLMIVKIYDHAKKPSLKLVNDAEYKTLNDEIVQEAKFWDKAMMAAEKAWKADSATSKKTFPKSAIAAKKISVVQKGLTDPAKASTKLSDMEKSMAEDAKADEQRLKERKGKSGGNAARRKTDDNKADQERASLLDSARSLFETKLSELAGAAGGAAAEPVNPPEPAPKKKGKK